MDLAKRFLFFVFSLIFVFLLPLTLAWDGELQKATFVCVISLVFLLVINADKIEAFKLWGLEATLKEKIQEASATIDELKKIAGTISKASLTDLMAGNFLGGVSFETKLHLHDEIEEALKEIGIPDEALTDIKENWNKGIAIIYDGRISSRLFGTVRGKEDQNLIKERKEHKKEYDALQDFSKWKARTPEEIENFAKAKNWNIDEETELLLNQYKYFLKTKEIKDRELLISLWN